MALQCNAAHKGVYNEMSDKFQEIRNKNTMCGLDGIYIFVLPSKKFSRMSKNSSLPMRLTVAGDGSAPGLVRPLVFKH